MTIGEGLNKAFNLSLLLAAWFLIGCAVVGAFVGEFYGYLMYGLLLSSCVVNLAVVLSCFLEKVKIRMARIIWCCLNASVLLIAFSIVNPEHRDALRDAGSIIGYPMLVSTFPAGMALSVSMSYLIDLRPQSFYLGNAYDWAVFFVPGYIQWFILLPMLVRYSKSRLPLRKN